MNMKGMPSAVRKTVLIRKIAERYVKSVNDPALKGGVFCVVLIKSAEPQSWKTEAK